MPIIPLLIKMNTILYTFNTAEKLYLNTVYRSRCKQSVLKSGMPYLKKLKLKYYISFCSFSVISIYFMHDSYMRGAERIN